MELVQGRAAGRGRSMIAVKKEKLDRAHNFARVMKELTMLGRFIRLADYLFVEGGRVHLALSWHVCGMCLACVACRMWGAHVC